jgi:hypothetical protein
LLFKIYCRIKITFTNILTMKTISVF